ncbi:hypothetical protein [Zavarzinia sp. CC-PAN008]|uniref:hypothetical protein n=1 Tax=Zavarzinia sp. CC-PAN008 TaxID=3243332 RepID=UPI003F7479CA
MAGLAVQGANAPGGLGGDGPPIKAAITEYKGSPLEGTAIDGLVRGRMLVAEGERANGRFAFASDGKVDFEMKLLTYDEATKGTVWRTLTADGNWRVQDNRLCLRLRGVIFDYEDCLDMYEAGGLVWSRYTDCGTLSASSACRKGQVAFAGRMSQLASN